MERGKEFTLARPPKMVSRIPSLGPKPESCLGYHLGTWWWLSYVMWFIRFNIVIVATSDFQAQTSLNLSKGYSVHKKWSSYRPVSRLPFYLLGYQYRLCLAFWELATAHLMDSSLLFVWKFDDYLLPSVQKWRSHMAKLKLLFTHVLEGRMNIFLGAISLKFFWGFWVNI